MVSKATYVQVDSDCWGLSEASEGRSKKEEVTSITPPKLIFLGALPGSRTETYHPGLLGPKKLSEDLTRGICRAGEMVLYVKYLLCKHQA